ncbi:MAG: hypothetical protein ACRDD1_08215 [Planctomycetia bacterium]
MTEREELSGVQRFDLHSLALFADGRLDETFKAMMRQISDDIARRVNVGNARKLIMEISLTPKAKVDPRSRSVEVEFVNMDIQFSTKAPKYGLADCELGIDANGFRCNLDDETNMETQRLPFEGNE